MYIMFVVHWDIVEKRNSNYTVVKNSRIGLLDFYSLIVAEPIFIGSSFRFCISRNAIAWKDNAATRVNNSDTPLPVLDETAQYSARILLAVSAARLSIISYTGWDCRLSRRVLEKNFADVEKLGEDESRCLPINLS